MLFHFNTNMPMPLHRNPCPRGHKIYNFTCISILYTQMVWNIQSLKCSTFSLEWLANSERSVNERWTHAEQKLSERRVNNVWTLNASCWTICERWTMIEGGTWTERKRERNLNGERTMNERWHFIRKVSGILLALYLTSTLVRIYMYELFNFVFLFNNIFLYKRSAWNRIFL